MAILSGELVPTAVRKPISDDANKRIAEGLEKAREAKKAAKVVASAPQQPAPAPAEAPVADTAREPGCARKAAKG